MSSPGKPGSAGQAWLFAGELVASAPGRCALVALLLLTAGVTEAFGLLMIVPLLQAAGLAGGAGEPGAAVAAMARLAARLEAPLTLPGVLGVFLALGALRSAAAWGRNVLSTRLRLEFVERIRKEIYSALAGASWGHLLGWRRSDIQYVLHDDVARIGGAAFLLVQIAVGVTLASVQFAIALAVSPAVAAVAAPLGLALAAVGRPLVRRSHNLGERLTGDGRVLRGHVTDFLDGLKPAKSHNAEAVHVERFERIAAEVRERQFAFAKLGAATRAGLQFAAAAALAGLVWYALARARLALPELLLLALVFARVTPTALNLLQWTQQLANALPAYAAATGLRETLLAAAEPGAAGGMAPGELRKGIEARELAFVYPGMAAPALREVAFRIPANGIFAITGHSGSGKTTLTDLLLGLLEPTRGGILVDGKALRGADLRRWRNSAARVAQEPFLLHDSVRANLSWARPGASESAMWGALRLAAADFVAELPQGLDTVVGDRGGRLSGGERQRVALAAALLREPTLLVLDEPTGHLDPGNESRVLATLRRLRGRATVVVVSHGGALLREAERILVLRSGRVEAIGAWPDVAALVEAARERPAASAPRTW